MRKVITDLLKKMNGVEPAEIARNGKAAVDYLAAHNDIDLVLMDIEMPIMNGIEALKQIKQKYSTPVIMLSALSNKEITIEALELGATDFVTKPVNLTAIESDWTRDLERKIKGSQMKKNERLHPTIERDKKLRREVALKEKKTDVELNRHPCFGDRFFNRRTKIAFDCGKGFAKKIQGSDFYCSAHAERFYEIIC